MKSVIYIDKDRNVWGLDEDFGYAMLESFEGSIGSEIIGDTDFAVIYDESSVQKIGNHRFITGDCLIMKSYYGFKGLSMDEIDQAREAFKKNTGRFMVGLFSFKAYMLSDGGR